MARINADIRASVRAYHVRRAEKMRTITADRISLRPLLTAQLSDMPISEVAPVVNVPSFTPINTSRSDRTTDAVPLSTTSIESAEPTSLPQSRSSPDVEQQEQTQPAAFDLWFTQPSPPDLEQASLSDVHREQVLRATENLMKQHSKKARNQSNLIFIDNRAKYHRMKRSASEIEAYITSHQAGANEIGKTTDLSYVHYLMLMPYRRARFVERPSNLSVRPEHAGVVHE
jgi:hypothetical protein